MCIEVHWAKLPNDVANFCRYAPTNFFNHPMVLLSDENWGRVLLMLPWMLSLSYVRRAASLGPFATDTPPWLELGTMMKM